MCDSHHPTGLSRRAAAGLLAAGAGLALMPLRASAQVTADTLCLMCIDHKFVKDAIAFFNSADGPGEGKYDVVGLAGASLAGITPRNGRRAQFHSTFGALREQLLFAKLPPGKGLHPNIRRVVVLDHLGCGAYENEYGPMTRDEEIAKHKGNADRVRPWLTSLGLESQFWLIKDLGVPPAPYPYI